MSTPPPTRRTVLATTAAAGAFSLGSLVAGTFGLSPAQAGAEDSAIRPFTINVSDDELVELRKRIAATRWPTKELVENRSQGVQLATIQKLARYWATEYDWAGARHD